MITHQTKREIMELVRFYEMSPQGREWVEQIVAEAVNDASCQTAIACRKLATDWMMEQRRQMYEQLRRVYPC